MKNRIWVIGLSLIVGLALGTTAGWYFKNRSPDKENEPATEGIWNALEKADLIRVDAPRPNQKITSPLTVMGEARGTWFFEASFPVKLVGENGDLIVQSHAEAQADPATGEVNWMTEDFVPFQATLEFPKPSTAKGLLILEKDNPSGLPEHADQLEIPVSFE
ncbi:MAG: Gmad2 immunoglobulin-like domain-containing protein [Candidatus Colwellbacteria bacterium]|nr:Gmad2 immunoglobulin-like domain-containing protein [Candidatus Colwellbacteria bacterium]